MSASDDDDDDAPLPTPRPLPAPLPVSVLGELDLAGLGLHELPDAVRALSGTLTKLNLAYNALVTLPPWLAELGRLRILFCLGNRFTAVPGVVGQLPSIRMLSFKSNRLTAVDEAALAPSLAWLILTDNRLACLPGSLGRLTRLRKLMLASNRLETLPDEIAHCSDLELIRLADNRLPPAELRKLVALPRLAWVAFAGQRAGPGDAVPPALQLAADRVVIGALLGEGASGHVHRATLLPDGVDVAAKIYRAASSDGLPGDEVDVACRVPPHPHLPHVLGVVTAPRLVLVMRLVRDAAALGTTPSLDSCTRDVFAPDQQLAPAHALTIARAVASAAAHLHAHGIVHGDLYAHNTLLAGDDTVVLCDYGAAWSVARLDADLRAALERVETRAFGCMLEELAQLAGEGGAALGKLAQRCMQPDVAARPSFTELVRELQTHV